MNEPLAKLLQSVLDGYDNDIQLKVDAHPSKLEHRITFLKGDKVVVASIKCYEEISTQLVEIIVKTACNEF